MTTNFFPGGGEDSNPLSRQKNCLPARQTNSINFDTICLAVERTEPADRCKNTPKYEFNPNSRMPLLFLHVPT